MPNINIENISDLDINGNDLFDDSESFITEISDENEHSVVGGFYFRYYYGGYFKNFGRYYGGHYGGYYQNNGGYRQTNNCGNTAACANTLGGYLG